MDRYDVDGGGSLDKEEFACVLKDMGVSIAGEELEKAWAIIDDDGSGGVDEEEFIEWWDNERHTLLCGRDMSKAARIAAGAAAEAMSFAEKACHLPSVLSRMHKRPPFGGCGV